MPTTSIYLSIAHIANKAEFFSIKLEREEGKRYESFIVDQKRLVSRAEILGKIVLAPINCTLSNSDCI